jgi:hypothetical protein
MSAVVDPQLDIDVIVNQIMGGILVTFLYLLIAWFFVSSMIDTMRSTNTSLAVKYVNKLMVKMVVCYVLVIMSYVALCC